MTFMKLEKTVKITNRGMITIPSRIRKKFNLKDGDEVVVTEDEGIIKIIPILEIEKIREMLNITKI